MDEGDGGVEEVRRVKVFIHAVKCDERKTVKNLHTADLSSLASSISNKTNEKNKTKKER